ILVVGEHRATVQARGIDTMMARGGDGLLKGIAPVVIHQQTHIAPRLAVIEAVKTVAGAHAGFAAGAFVEIHLKGELLAGLWKSERNETPVLPRLRRFLVRFVPLRKSGGCGKLLLLLQ